MKNICKKTLIFLFSVLNFTNLFADKYKIENVEYDISGKTRKYALETKVKADKSKIFENEEELLNYIKDFQQRVLNTRNFEEVNVDFVIKDKNEEEIFPVIVKVYVKDSKHLLVLPYPKYDSNTGFVLKLKAKDTNFIGSLEEMSGDFNFQIETDKNPVEYTAGFALDFTVPFKLGKLKENFINTHSFSYTIGKSTPEWDFKIGLTSELPFEKFSLNLDLYQSFIRNLDYEDKQINDKTVHFGDGTYFAENAKFSVPITVQKITNWGNLTYTPYLQMIYYWDFDGIHKYNEDLQSPIFSVGQTISTSRVNWEGNFRKGAELSVNQSFAYNLYKGNFIPGIEAEAKGFNHSKFIGLNIDFYAFAYLNDTKNIGSRLRGIKDDLYFSYETEMNYQKATSTYGGIVLNLDLPIHIFTTNWSKVPLIKKINFFDKYLNFELQISPFLDIALVHNQYTNRSMDYKDGFYAAGLEVLVFPLKWKGIVVRGSFGIDLGRTIPGFKGKLDQSWRDDVSKYEFTFGIGLLY